MSKYLCYATDKRTGNKVPLGLAENEADLNALKAFANQMGLNLVYDYETVKNPDHEELDPIIEKGKQIVSAIQSRNKAMDLDDIYDLYDNGTISGTEARHRIEALYAGDPEEVVEAAIEGLYADRHNDDYYDDDYKEDYDEGYDDEEEDEDEGNNTEIHINLS